MLNTVLIKPVSSLCNMNCSYCFYRDEASKRKQDFYGLMSEKTIENIIKKTLAQGKSEYCFAFQGGEPSLIGLDFYRKVVQFEEQYNLYHSKIVNTFQTNGLYLDEGWCEFFKKNHFLIGISLDGTETTHDLYRHDQNGAPSYHKVFENIKYMQAYGVEFNILTVLNQATANNIKEIYKTYQRNGWKYQQYIACIDPLFEEHGKQDYSLTPYAYGRCLIDLFHLWYKDWRKGRTPYIRQFENYIEILMGYEPEACEHRGICSIQCVTESDGNVYPCDFYVLDEYRLGNFNENTIESFFSSDIGCRFVSESQTIHTKCKTCEFYFLCRSGCRRSRITDPISKQSYSYFCEAYKMFFTECLNDMNSIVTYLKRK